MNSVAVSILVHAFQCHSLIVITGGNPLGKYTMIYLFIRLLMNIEIRGSQTSLYTRITWERRSIAP